MPRIKPKYAYFLCRLVAVAAASHGRVVSEGWSTALERTVYVKTDAGSRIRFGRRVYVKRGANIEAFDGGEIIIGAHTFINRYCSIVSRSRIYIGGDCLIGDGVSIYDHNHKVTDAAVPYRRQGYVGRPVRIGNNVWIGAKVFIGAGVTIGDNVVIGAHTVVTKDVPSDCIVYGRAELTIRPLRTVYAEGEPNRTEDGRT